MPLAAEAMRLFGHPARRWGHEASSRPGAKGPVNVNVNVDFGELSRALQPPDSFPLNVEFRRYVSVSSFGDPHDDLMRRTSIPDSTSAVVGCCGVSSRVWSRQAISDWS